MDQPSSLEPAGTERPATIEALRPLLGIWRGAGHGRYPTIDSFEYVEELTFTTNEQQPLLHYVQRTWRRQPDGAAGEPLHSESGFWRCTPEGWFEISNAQEGGRVEVLRGGFGPMAAGTLVLVFESVVLAHDARLLRSERSFHLENGVLRTCVGMATVRNPAMTTHLEAVLTQSP